MCFCMTTLSATIQSLENLKDLQGVGVELFR
jgi:hypothetical protein